MIRGIQGIRASIAIFLLSAGCFALQYDVTLILSYLHRGRVVVALLPLVFIGLAAGTYIVSSSGRIARLVPYMPLAGLSVFACVIVFSGSDALLIPALPALFAFLYAPLAHLLFEPAFSRRYVVDLFGGVAGFGFAWSSLAFAGAEGVYLSLWSAACLIPWAMGAVRSRMVQVFEALCFVVGLAAFCAQLLWGPFDLPRVMQAFPENQGAVAGSFIDKQVVEQGALLAHGWSPVSRVDIVHLSDASDALYYNRIRWSVFGERLSYSPYGILKVVAPAARSALVMGVGAGRDIQRLESAGINDIQGVEVNDATHALLSGAYADLADDAYLRHPVHLAEGRAYLESSAQTYDMILLPMTDLYVSASSDFVTIESFLYTKEAFRAYWERLTPGGLIWMQRFTAYDRPDDSGEVFTITATIRSFLTEIGSDPSEHLLVFSGGDPVASLQASVPQKDQRRSIYFVLSKAPLPKDVGMQVMPLLDKTDIGARLLYPGSAGESALNRTEACARRLLVSGTAPCVGAVPILTDDNPYFWVIHTGAYLVSYLSSSTNIVFFAAFIALSALVIYRLRRTMIGKREWADIALVSVSAMFFGLLVPMLIHEFVFVLRSPIVVSFIVQVAFLTGCTVAAGLSYSKFSAPRLSVACGLALLVPLLFIAPDWLVRIFPHESSRALLISAYCALVGVGVGSIFPTIIASLVERSETLSRLAASASFLGSALGMLLSIALTIALGLHATECLTILCGITILAALWMRRGL